MITTIPELKTAKIDHNKFTSDLPYTLCEQDGEPLGPRRLKFIEREIEAGRTRLVFMLGDSGMKELRTCCTRMYYNSLVFFKVIYQPE